MLVLRWTVEIGFTATDGGAGTPARLGFAWPKTVWGHRGFLPRVQCGGGWPQGGCRWWLGLLELRRHRTASPEILRP
jgi:hypothetical protein